jgi:ParB/RepB/Spo0J family partition protein
VIDAAKKEYRPGRVYLLDSARVKPFALNPRKRFAGIQKLADSIRLVGQITPVVVRRSADPDFDAELVDGERRLRACLKAGLKVRAIFEAEDATAEAIFERSVAANFCRQPHDTVEVMRAVCAMRALGRSAEEIQAITGRSDCWVYQHLALRKLAPQVLKKLLPVVHGTKTERRQAGKRLSFNNAQLLARLPREVQLELVKLIEERELRNSAARVLILNRLRPGDSAKPTGWKAAHRPAAAANGNGAAGTHFERLAILVRDCTSAVEGATKLPGEKFRQALAGMTRQQRKDLAAGLERLCEQALMLGDAIAK